MNFKWHKFKEIYTKIYYNQNRKAKKKERILKAAKEKQFITCKGGSARLTAGFCQKSWEPEGQHIHSARKKNVNQKFYILPKCPLKMKEKLRHSHIKRNKSYC